MKKFTVSILFLFIFICFQGLISQAGTANEFPIGKNYLDLSNFIMKSDSSGYAFTIEPIMVKPNQAYTIVFAYGFLGQHIDHFGDIYTEIEELPSHSTHQYILTDDYPNQRAYIEFTPITSSILINELPMLPMSYDAIMYEGAYQNFSGYEPFIPYEEQIIYEGVLPIDYDEPMTATEIKSFLHAYDPYGYELNISLESDSYSNGPMLPGSYEMIFNTTFNQIVKQYILEVKVFDQSPPIIVNPGTLSIPLSQKSTLEEIKQQIEVSDNVDTLTYADLVTIEDTYSAANTVGLYSITLQVTDSSDNLALIIIPIELIDITGPTITGPNEVFLYTTDQPISDQEIKDYFTIIDDVDGTNVIVEFSVNNYHQTQSPGVYRVTIKAFDSQMNYRTKNLDIHVIENRGPVFTTDEIILSLPAAQSMSEEEIIDWFVTHTLAMGINVENVSILFNEYDSHENQDGEYYVYLNYDMNGESQQSRIMVSVDSEESTNNWIKYLGIGSPLLIGGIIIFIIKKKK
ncbi:MAG: hypothetical protein JXC31_00960 [Acholeplasmataceae bacterium]|nr:hypothetical protein [Acholeplasmataceae bacterium]